MNHAEKAHDLFLNDYNCAQSVLCAYDDVTGFDPETSALLASSFGGGMGRLREACGAFSAALMVLGLVCGYADPGDQDAKTLHYQRVQEYARRFRDANGSILCRELLEDVPVTPGDVPEERTPEYYAARPCPQIVRQAAAILDEMLAEEQAACR